MSEVRLNIIDSKASKHVPIHGSVFLLAFLSLPYIFVSLSLGILISSKANTQSEAMQLAFLTILPSIFFSGYIFPRETMKQVRSGSGVRYSDGKIVWWNKGYDGFLEDETEASHPVKLAENCKQTLPPPKSP